MWQQLLKPVDYVIDQLSMYRLLMYYLLFLLVAAMGLSATGVIHYNAVDIALAAGITTFACWIINRVFAYTFNAPVNPESSILTGLILSLIITPSFQTYGLLFMLAASGLAIASKYLLTIRNKHIFNPAAIAVVLTAIGPRQDASWWIGTAWMLPFVIVGGLLIVRKVRRGSMVAAYLIATTVVTAGLSLYDKSSVTLNLKNMILTSAIFYLGFVMLTEPYSSPTTRTKQIYYAIIVGVLVAPQFHVGHYYTTPEVALVIGNLFAYLVSPKTKLFPVLREKLKVARDTAEFVFIPDRRLAYLPGQYMEWTLPHEHADSRGSRRWFTLSSSPTEKFLRVGVKFVANGSSYKDAMLDMDNQTPIVAAQVAGDFVMPESKKKKLAFIAGGIGITPFRSMIKFLIDKQQPRDIVLLYSAKTVDDVAYRSVFDQAKESIGLRTTYFITGKQSPPPEEQNFVRGMISPETIKRKIPDYNDRLFYISGTHQMVEAVTEMLMDIGVDRGSIKTDFFPGYA